MLNKKSIIIKPENFQDDEAWKGLWDEFLGCFLNSKELTEEINAEHYVFAKALE